MRDEGRGLPVLALHSLGGSLSMWDGFARSALPDMRLIRFDARLHGTCALPGPFDIARNAQDAIDVLDTLGIERAVVMGISMGGHTAMQVAISHPHRVRALVLANTSAGGTAPEVAAQRLEGIRAQIRELGFSAFAEQYVRSRLAPDVDSDVGAAYRLDVENSGANAYVQTLASILRQDFRSQVASIAAPTLVVCGELDASTPPAAGAVLANGIPRARLVTLAGAGHFSCLDQPGAFNKAVLEFLDAVQREET
ncbi:alpha/beta fold hydrolase [Ramlibacter sp.]|uniref:alpha/beta fold hydrolase n=1 Tax=Ramlibacter sp. TaxID=1917967 RepID=UPI003D0DA26E